MELRQLEYFIAVAEEANFTRAAERSRISQSGVSAQVRQLERELGAELIDRSGRTAGLTTAGEAALEHARTALAAVRAVRESVGEVTGLLRGNLTVGMVVGCTILPLFDALARFHHDHPGVDITLLEDNSDRLIEAVRTGKLDLALVGTARATPEGLDALTIINERLVAVAPLSHPLMAGSAVGLDDLAKHSVICMPQGTGVRTAFDQSCVAHGVAASIALQASAADAIADLAGRGLGVGILTESMASRYSNTLEVRSVAGAEVPVLLSLVWAKRNTPALRAILGHSNDAFAQQQS